MTMTTAMVRSLLERDNGEAIILLLTISHASLGTPFRVCTNRVGSDIVSGGNTFIGAPIELGFPNDDDETPVAELRCYNVYRLVGLALEGLTGPATCTIQAVLASAPNTVEREATLFELRDCEWDGIAVSGQLTRARLTSEPCPKYRVTPRTFPALFR